MIEFLVEPSAVQRLDLPMQFGIHKDHFDTLEGSTLGNRGFVRVTRFNEPSVPLGGPWYFDPFDDPQGLGQIVVSGCVNVIVDGVAPELNQACPDRKCLFQDLFTHIGGSRTLIR